MDCGCNNKNSSLPRSCGVDPCKAEKTSTDLVFYTGENLECSDVEKCNSLSLILQKIDNQLCPESIFNTIILTLQTNPSLQDEFCQLVNSCQSTTTTTSTSSTTTTTTSTSSTTTTTTTTLAPTCVGYSLSNPSDEFSYTYLYFNCETGDPVFGSLLPSNNVKICTQNGQIFAQPELEVSIPGPCED
jgi:hypothetical protein